ncbi:glycosyltransferase family 25 protein [Sporocytophaga myxococcoides]|uniref:glycosyltransferase family 25 protein n=1 Tax=Sporocytophaga myxococcoides TaxID=153721 RepID=UPI0003FD4593|nr:hypothetical protein [Sporocytophaga myxococcoides]
MLAEFFDHCYLINLPERVDRKELSLLECKAVGLTPEIFPAINGRKDNIVYHNPGNIDPIAWNLGAAGLMKTTELILLDAKAKGYDKILILEDDVEFHPQVNEIFDDYKSTIPDDWEFFQLGCCHKEIPEKVNFRIFRITNADCLHCYGVHSRVYDSYLEKIQKMDMPLDHVSVKYFQPKGTCYCLFPNFAYQRPNFSNIAGRDVNYCFLK